MPPSNTPNNRHNVAHHLAGRHLPSVIVFVAITATILTADLTVKSLAFRYIPSQPVKLTRHNSADHSIIPDHAPVTLVPKVLAIKLTTNTGAIFGLGKGSQWLFIVISIVATIVLLNIFYRSRPGDFSIHTTIALILAGALGNLHDRILFNAVRDMFWLFPGIKLPFGWSWPGDSHELYPWIFNIADATLIIGVFSLVVILWQHDKQSQTAQSAHD